MRLQSHHKATRNPRIGPPQSGLEQNEPKLVFGP
jgi:hypothetical protein